MTTGTLDGLSLDKTGLVSGHAYSIISAHHVEGVRLLKLRNPWGKTEWKGAYSDKSDKWTDSMKRAVNFVDANDGSFFMTVEDYKNHFGHYDVGHYHDGFHFSRKAVFCNPHMPN